MVNNGTDRPSTIENLIEEIKSEQVPTPSVTPLTDVTPAPEVKKVLEDVLNEEDKAVDEVVAPNTPQAENEALSALFKEAPTTTVLDEDEDDDLDDDDDTEGEIMEDEEDEPQTSTEEGHATTDEEDFPHEAEALKAFLASNPEHSAAHCEYAAMMIHEENFGEAQRVLDALFAKQPNNLDAILMLAYLAEQSKDYFKCKQLLEKVTVLNPDFNGIYYKLGVLINQHFKGQKKAAARYFREAIRRDPKNADAHYQYAVIKLEHSGNYVKAIELFLQTLELDPKHSKASFDLAVAFYELGDKANAAKHYARACELNPEFKTATYDEIFHYEPPQPEPTPVAEVVTPQIKDNGIVVMVTGATSGIGKATAARFAQEGYRVIMTGRREDRLAELKESFDTEFKNKNHIISFDVRNLQDVNEVVNTLGEDWQNVDILINNAGLALGFAPIHEGDINDWDTMIDTNIKGLLYMTRAIAPKMVARKRGHIVNICSTAGKEIYPNGNVYCATKVAVDALTKGMRQDLFRHGIRVSQVAPGHVEETEFALVRFHGDAEKANIYEGFSPLKASDVADAIYYAVTRPANVNIQDILIMPTQQAGFGLIEKSGRLEN
jgi:NADP-dependent 3-hydroxy acid dehydrogenase YdfG/thioredoxin-like negative regulator of GroEL